MHEQMAQLRMRGVGGGHDGATRSLGLPINTALRPADKSIFGLRLLAKTGGIGPDQPTDLWLDDSPLRGHGGIEQGKIEQTVGHGRLDAQ